MKKIFTYMAMVMAVVMFAACDDIYNSNNYYDEDDAYTLEGTWTGYIETYLYDRFGLTGNDYRTTMYFERENRYGGWGYEVDYNLRSIYDDYYYCEFEWEVVDGVIYVDYADSWNTVQLYPTRLTNNRFTGRMFDGTTRDIYFDLVYDGAFDWGYWTRSSGFTRSADGKRYQASGEVANIKKEASN